MPSIIPVVCLAAFLLAVSVVASDNVGRVKQNLRGRGDADDEDSLICLILQINLRKKSGDENLLECDLISEADGSMVHGLQITLPTNLVEDNRKTLHRGEWFVRIFGAKVEETLIEEYGPLRTSVFVPEHATIVTIPPNEGDQYMEAVQGRRSSRYLVEDRNLAQKSVRRILVARVSTSNSAPSYSASQLQQFYFDLNSYSVVRQYALCSSSWLWFKGYNNQNPVVEVYVPGSAGSFNERSLLSAALNQLQSQLHVKSITSLTEHVAFIFPPGIQGGTWYGYGTVGSYRSVFNDKTGGIPNTAMHEIGHNLGLRHAGVGSDQYEDTTDIMGYGDFQQFGPSRCFNGYHIWELGWFTDRSVTVDAFSHTVIQIACFVDYGKTEPGQYVVVNVGPLYLVFNQAVGVNSGTEAVPNQVTIVEPGPLYSYRVGSISVNSSPFEVANYDGSVGTLIIKVCQIITWNNIQLAVVSIGVNNDSC